MIKEISNTLTFQQGQCACIASSNFDVKVTRFFIDCLFQIPGMRSIVKQLFGPECEITGYSLAHHNNGYVFIIEQGERKVCAVVQVDETTTETDHIKLKVSPPKHTPTTEDDLRVIIGVFEDVPYSMLKDGVVRFFKTAQTVGGHLYYKGDTRGTGLCVVGDPDDRRFNTRFTWDDFCLGVAKENEGKQLRFTGKTQAFLHTKHREIRDYFGVETRFDEDGSKQLRDVLMKSPLAFAAQWGGCNISVKMYPLSVAVEIASGDKVVGFGLRQVLVDGVGTGQVEVEKRNPQTSDDDLNEVRRCMCDLYWEKLCHDMYGMVQSVCRLSLAIAGGGRVACVGDYYEPL